MVFCCVLHASLRRFKHKKRNSSSVFVTEYGDHWTPLCGKTVGLFLTSAAIDLVRKNGIDHTHVKPMEPLKDLLTAFMERGGDVWVCPPCTTARGYVQESMIDGVVISGASVIFERIKNGAATLTF